MTVLVAYHASPHGEAAVRSALAESQGRDVPLHVLVLDPQPASDPTPPELAVLLGSTGAAVSYRGEQDEPADAILDTADSVGATLVVVGSRKRASQGTFLMGTTTQRVLLDASVPVLVVKDVYDA